jgi:cytochrome c-type biogenesis protein CcmF
LLKSPGGFDWTARESFLLYNNILLVTAAIMVFVGTMAPLIADAIGAAPVSVGAPFFDMLFPVVMLPLCVLVSIGIHAAWKRGRISASKRRLLTGLALAIGLGLLLVFAAFGGPSKWLTPIGTVVGIWIIVSSLFDPIDRLRRKLTLPRAIVGMTIAHMGLGVGLVAISTVESYTVERDVALAPGEHHRDRGA